MLWIRLDQLVCHLPESAFKSAPFKCTKKSPYGSDSSCLGSGEQMFDRGKFEGLFERVSV